MTGRFFRSAPRMSTGRRILSLLSSAALLSSLLVLTASPVYALIGHCDKAYLRVYDGDTQSSANRLFCYGLADLDIESEPGDVMGPLGDGNPVVRRDDFDTLATSSGVNSVYFYSSSGTWTACLYPGKNYTGGGFAIEHTFSHGAYYTVLGTSETTMGSLKIVSGTACP